MENSLFSSGRQVECAAGQKSLEPLVMPCLMASPLQGLIPDIERGEGGDRIEISANRQSPAFLQALSPPLKTFWKTEQKQWGNPKGWGELHSPCTPITPCLCPCRLMKGLAVRCLSSPCRVICTDWLVHCPSPGAKNKTGKAAWWGSRGTWWPNAVTF